MKRTTILIFAVFMGLMGFSQEDNNNKEYKTLFGSNNMTHGGYGAMSINYSQLDGEDALLVGMRGAWIINHGIGIGLGGYGITNNINRDLYGDGYQYQLAGGYGGLLIEPIIGANNPVHISIPVLIGAGGIAYVNHSWTSAAQQPYHNGNYMLDSQAFFVLEPGVELELNMVRFFRIALGAYYRYTSDVSLTYYKLNTAELVTENPDLKGFSFGITLKFGKF